MNDRRIYTDTLQIFTIVDALFLSTNLPRAKSTRRFFRKEPMSMIDYG